MFWLFCSVDSMFCSLLRLLILFVMEFMVLLSKVSDVVMVGWVVLVVMLDFSRVESWLSCFISVVILGSGMLVGIVILVFMVICCVVVLFW